MVGLLVEEFAFATALLLHASLHDADELKR
jgi:hypothetical protein